MLCVRVSDLAQAIAIAAFAVLIGLEWYVERVRAARRGRPAGYPFHDSITNLSIGLGSVLFGGIAVLQGVTVHAWLDEHAALARLPMDSVAVWIGITIAVDFCFYWSHRAMHRVNLLWTIHAPHHQSEEYNFLVALRVAWWSVYFSWIFYLPLAIGGVTVGAVLLSRGTSSLYQFLLHTRLVGKLGVLEHVLNTPSHHRVHHGKDAQYLDKNYGGILIVWDRWFGTFAEEVEEPTYGTARRFDGFDPLWSNAIEWVRLARMTRATRRLRDKVQLWLRPPEWRPADLESAKLGEEAAAAAASTPAVGRDRRAGRAAVPRPIDVYIAVNFVLVLGAALLSMVYTDRVTTGGSALIAAELLVAFVVWGALIEAKRWAFWLEWARLGSLVVVAAVLGASGAAAESVSPPVLGLALGLAAVAGLGAWSARLAVISRA
jgi:sterol desaturase/sphingolipid hydroxylase (fatty acid hydroxylase superfamily)